MSCFKCNGSNLVAVVKEEYINLLIKTIACLDCKYKTRLYDTTYRRKESR